MKSVKSFYDQAAKTYDRCFQHKVALIENALATQDLPASNVLDLGCGTGLFLEYCPPKGYVGLDISAEMIRVARAKFPQAQFIQANMAMIPLPDASVDSVISLFGSFSYCLQPHRCVDEIYRVLRPNGIAVIMAMGQRYIHRRSHLAHGLLPFWTYTARQLRHLFSDFDFVTIRGLNLALDWLKWLPTPMLRGYAQLEHATLSRLMPDACYFLLVEARKERCPSES